MAHEPFLLIPTVEADIRHEAEAYRRDNGGLLPDTRDWRFLEHRWREDVPRFTHWHPVISKWIAEDYDLRHLVPPACPQTPVVVQPADPTVSAAPEPSSLVLWIVAIVVICCWRRWR